MSGAAAAQNTIISTYRGPGFEITFQQTAQGENFLRYEGTYVETTGVALATAIRINPNIAYLEMSSLGGALAEIEEPVTELQERGIPVVVRAGDVCASACAFMALASPDIRIEGLMAFHLPYSEVYLKEDSLYAISQSSVEMTLLMSRQLFLQGWKLTLYYNIQQNSGLDSWVVFDNSDDLDRYRFTDPATFMDTIEATPSYYVMSTAEVMAALAAQAVDNTP
jgi:hypothetical protein